MAGSGLGRGLRVSVFAIALIVIVIVSGFEKRVFLLQKPVLWDSKQGGLGLGHN